MIDKKIKNKYKQLKYQHLKKIYEKNLIKLPWNCKYNKEVQLPNRNVINICSFNLEDNFAVDLCYKKEHSQECNAFCPRVTKEELFRDFMLCLKDDQLRATYYKDINVLYWMHPQLNFDEFPENEKWFKRLKSWLRKVFK